MNKTDVYAHFGGCSKVAKALGITTASVASWGDVIPEGRAYQVQVVTDGRLKVDRSVYQQSRATA